jgi:hypothetical protein
LTLARRSAGLTLALRGAGVTLAAGLVLAGCGGTGAHGRTGHSVPIPRRRGAEELIDIQASSPRQALSLTTELAAADFRIYVVRPDRAGQLDAEHPRTLALARDVVTCTLAQIIRSEMTEAHQAGATRTLSALRRLTGDLGRLAAGLGHDQAQAVGGLEHQLDRLAQRFNAPPRLPPAAGEGYLRAATPEPCG